MSRIPQHLREHWERIPYRRRWMLQGAAWAVVLLVLWQWGWLDSRWKLQQAERSLTDEQMLSRQLHSVMASPNPGRSQPLSPGRLSEHAQAAGLRVVGMDTHEGRVDVQLEGQPDALLHWLHEVEREGTQVGQLQLQRSGNLLQVRLGVVPGPS
ncbi:type II secretion system protein GspM [Pseudomonas sp. KU43P]|uniref:type II secretion system protein GspM n=1 Tax=Pseudomonas sp. KU43P TaxID=2487887 RepID=UPI0012A8BE91|nr:type II secretion system protein GspM [Pseudomonas sp. KU43P]BBH43847.1 hypothetical protein KU43P_03240 [Pseudomonas sp. KU43P]